MRQIGNFLKGDRLKLKNWMYQSRKVTPAARFSVCVCVFVCAEVDGKESLGPQPLTQRELLSACPLTSGQTLCALDSRDFGSYQAHVYLLPKRTEK